jgi:hypothetical protein
VADLGGSSNAAIAFDFLVSKGLSCEQAAAVVGNLQVESYLNPKNDVPDPKKNDPSARGRGIASWDPTRWQNLLTFAAGRDPLSLGVQLEFLWHELPSNGLAQLASTTRLEDAVVVFQNLFERPRVAHTDKRIAAAQAALYYCQTIIVPKKSTSIWVAAGALALGALAAIGIYKAKKRPPAYEIERFDRYPPPDRWEPEPDRWEP